MTLILKGWYITYRFAGNSSRAGTAASVICGRTGPSRLKTANTVHGAVSYWEFECPNLDRFISWDSVDRRNEEYIDALHSWIVDTVPYESSINRLGFSESDICAFCDDQITRSHPLAPGRMIGLLGDAESASEIDVPSCTEESGSWEGFLLRQIYGSSQLVSHDGCAAYWSE